MLSLQESYGCQSDEEDDQLSVDAEPLITTDIKEHISKINLCPQIDESVIDKPKPFEIPKKGQLNYNLKYEEIAPSLPQATLDEYCKKKMRAPLKGQLTNSWSFWQNRPT